MAETDAHRLTLGISAKEIENGLLVDNPWRGSQAGSGTHLKELPRRGYFDLFAKRVLDAAANRAVFLMGPGRVGKTVMVQHMIQELLDRKIEPTCVFDASLDTRLYIGLSLEQLCAIFRKVWAASATFPA